jgi:hypothetical protein
MVIPGTPGPIKDIFIFDEKDLYKEKLNYLIKQIPEKGYSPSEFEAFLSKKDKNNRKAVLTALSS